MTRHFISSLAAGALAIAALSVAPAHSLAFEYVANGGFETGTDPWRAIGGTLTSVPDNTASSGTRVGRLEIPADSSSASAQQVLASPAPAGDYHLAMQLRLNHSGAPITVQVRLRAGDTERSATTTLDSSAWETQQVDLALPAPADLLVTVTVTGNPSDSVDIDAVGVSGIDPNSITPSPTGTAPPASPTMTPSTTATATRSPTPTKTATPTPDNYVGQLRNGDFESTQRDGALVGWKNYGGTLSIASGPAHAGEHAARLESTTDSTKWLYQAVSVEPGATYAFSAWVCDDDPNVASAFLRVSWYASGDGSGSALGADDSTARIEAPQPAFRSLTTTSITAPPDAHSARVRIMLAPLSSAPAAIYVDDAAFEPAPPSAATAQPTASGSTADRATNSVLGATYRSGGASGGEGGAVRLSASRVVINEIFYDSAASGTDAENEWIELYNAGDVDQDVTGWTVEDNAAADAIGPLVVPARGYAIIAASDSFSDAYPAYHDALAIAGGRIGNSLGNDGDRLALKDATGSPVDAVSWGKDTSVLNPSILDAPAGHSIERRTPGADTGSAADFVDNVNPSPGAPFVPAASPGAKPQQQHAASGDVPIITGEKSPFRAQLPWLALGSAITLVAVALAWRLAPIIRQRWAR